MLVRLTALVLVLATACGGGGGGGSSAAPATDADVLGEWFGTWSSSGGVHEGFLSLTLSKPAAFFVGPAFFTSSPCLTSASTNATLSGSTLAGTISAAGNVLEFSATISSPFGSGELSASGTYVVTSGQCDGDTGWISATKSAPAAIDDPAPQWRRALLVDLATGAAHEALLVPPR